MCHLVTNHFENSESNVGLGYFIGYKANFRENRFYFVGVFVTLFPVFNLITAYEVD